MPSNQTNKMIKSSKYAHQTHQIGQSYKSKGTQYEEQMPDIQSFQLESQINDSKLAKTKAMCTLDDYVVVSKHIWCRMQKEHNELLKVMKEKDQKPSFNKRRQKAQSKKIIAASEQMSHSDASTNTLRTCLIDEAQFISRIAQFKMAGANQKVIEEMQKLMVQFQNNGNYRWSRGKRALYQVLAGVHQCENCCKYFVDNKSIDSHQKNYCLKLEEPQQFSYQMLLFPSFHCSKWYAVCFFCSSNHLYCSQGQYHEFLIHQLICHPEQLKLIGMSELALKFHLINMASAMKSLKLKKKICNQLTDTLKKDKGFKPHFWDLFQLEKTECSVLITEHSVAIKEYGKEKIFIAPNKLPSMKEKMNKKGIIKKQIEEKNLDPLQFMRSKVSQMETITLPEEFLNQQGLVSFQWKPIGSQIVKKTVEIIRLDQKFWLNTKQKAQLNDRIFNLCKFGGLKDQPDGILFPLNWNFDNQKLFIKYQSVGQTLSAMLDVELSKRHQRKEIFVEEFWFCQVFEVIIAIEWLHDRGWATGSVSSDNIVYIPYKEPWGKLHCPGLIQAGQGPKNLMSAQWPYYEEGSKTITQEDEVLATSVLLVECLFADTNLREYWNHYAQNGSEFDWKVKKLLRESLKGYLEPNNRHHEIAIAIKEVVDGKYQTLKGIREVMEKKLKEIHPQACKHNWQRLAYHWNPYMAQYVTIDFFKGKNFTQTDYQKDK